VKGLEVALRRVDADVVLLGDSYWASSRDLDASVGEVVVRASRAWL
jgi:hypothetical protein